MLTPEQEQLLRLYRTQDTMRDACRIAGCDGSTHYAWLNTSSGYKTAFKDINQQKLDEHWKKKHEGE